MMETLVYDFFVQLTLNSTLNSPVHPNKKASQRLNSIKDYIHAYAPQEISLEKLSHISGISKYHLIRQFQSSFGITPHQYQIQARILKAKTLLKTGQQPAQVALESGFYDQSHMNRYFKKSLGTTSSQYQIRVSR